MASDLMGKCYSPYLVSSIYESHKFPYLGIEIQWFLGFCQVGDSPLKFSVVNRDSVDQLVGTMVMVKTAMTASEWTNRAISFTGT